MEKVRICKHRFLAGFLAFIMFWTVFVTGIFFAVRGGMFYGSSIKEIVDKNELNEVLYSVCDNMFDKEIVGEELSWITESENYDEIKEETIDILLGCLLEKKEDVDFSSVVDMLIETVEDESEVIVDEVFDEIENLSEDFDARENEYVQSIVDTYSLEVSDEFYDEINSYTQYADDLEEYRDEIKEEIDTQIIEPVKEEKDNISAELNASFNETINEYYASEAFETIETADDMLVLMSTGLSIVNIGCVALSLLFMLVICLLYRRGIYGAFSKFAVIMGVSGTFLIFIGAVKNTVNTVLDSVIGSELAELEEAIGDNAQVLIDKILGGVFDPFMKVGIVYMIIMVIAIVIWAVTKGIHKNKMNNDKTDFTNMSNTTNTINTTDYTNMSNTTNGGQIM